jgi:rRNA maturation endonuclease Nob1
MPKGFAKTTGKNYEDDDTLQCQKCSEIFERSVAAGKDNVCPKCGAPAFPFQRTVSTVTEEKANEKDIQEAIGKLS